MPGLANEILSAELVGSTRRFKLRSAVVTLSPKGEYTCNCNTVLLECHLCGTVRSEGENAVSAICICGGGMERVVKNTPKESWKPGISSGGPPCEHVESAYLYFLNAESKALKMKQSVISHAKQVEDQREEAIRKQNEEIAQLKRSTIQPGFDSQPKRKIILE